jgi:hypothetical protein
MARYLGGTQAPGGIYWNARRLTMVSVPAEGGALPGDAGDRYRSVHWAVALLVAPVLGGLYVVILPFIGFGMLAAYAWRRAAGGARQGASELAATMAPGWRPGEAHLTGRPGAPAAEGEVAAGGAGEEALRHVADEIAHRRAAPKDESED